MLALSVLPLAALESAPASDSDLAAIYAPWIGADGAVVRAASAGGAIVRLGLIGAIVVVHDERPGLAGRLRASGAWLLLDPKFLGGCLAG